jgi:hypothetical protein
MRKASILVIFAVLVLSLIGCSQQAEEAGIDESPAPTSSFSAGETEETTPQSEESTAITETVTSTPAATEQSTAATVSEKPQQSDSGKSTATPKTEAPPPAPTASTQTEKPKPTEPLEPSEPPAPPTPDFDPQLYVDYAISYGQSIGLIYEPRIGTGNWNAPQNIYASLTDESMKSGIRSSCERLVREGFEYFWVSAVKQGDQSYQLFVYYG